MCDPVSLTMAGLSIAGTTAGYIGQQQAAADQAKYQNERYSETARIALENYQSQINQQQARFGQEVALTADQAMANQIEAMKLRSTASVAAGEAGVAGNSVQALLDDFSRQEAMNRFSLATNLGWKEDQMDEELRAAQADARSQIASATPVPVRQPSLLGAALQIGTAAFGGFDTFQRNQRIGPYNPNPNATGNSWLTKRLF